jgi:NADH-quinone oxidoreductase subunit N
MTNDLAQSINAIFPVIIVAVWACVLLLADLFIPKDRKGITALLAAFGLAAGFGNVIVRMGSPTTGFGGMVVADDFANFICLLVLASGLAGIALSFDYLRRIEVQQGEYYVLLMFSICGMMLMSMSSDLIMVFLSLELLSIPLYVLAGIAIPRLNSEEAGIKYFLLGAFSSGFFLYGTALVYGATGSTSLKAIVTAVQSNQSK